MSNANFTVPGVNILIEGVVPLLFKRQNNQIVACDIGAIKHVPDHFFSFVVEKNGIPINLGRIEDKLELIVHETSQRVVTLKNPNAQIDRLTGEGDRQSFNWVLDFEGNEVYTGGIGVIQSELGPTLRIDRGELSTADISDNHLLKRLRRDDQWSVIGKVATLVRAHIDLDQANSVAVLRNGTVEVNDTRTRQGERLDITIRMSRPDTDDHPHPDDANNYHRAIGSSLGSGQKLTFKSTPLTHETRRVTPEASCLVGRLGTTPAS